MRLQLEHQKNSLKNLELNNFKNINFINKAVSDKDDLEIYLNESEKDWESSLSHKQFRLKSVNK